MGWKSPGVNCQWIEELLLMREADVWGMKHYFFFVGIILI